MVVVFCSFKYCQFIDVFKRPSSLSVIQDDAIHVTINFLRADFLNLLPCKFLTYFWTEFQLLMAGSYSRDKKAVVMAAKWICLAWPLQLSATQCQLITVWCHVEFLHTSILIPLCDLMKIPHKSLIMWTFVYVIPFSPHPNISWVNRLKIIWDN